MPSSCDRGRIGGDRHLDADRARRRTFDDERAGQAVQHSGMPEPPRPTSSNARERFITVADFARLAQLTRLSIDRYRSDRPESFPTKYDLRRGRVPRPRFTMAMF